VATAYHPAFKAK